MAVSDSRPPIEPGAGGMLPVPHTALPPLAYLSPTNSTGPTILISTTRRSRGDRGCSEACTHPKRAALWCQFKRRSRSKLTGSGSFRYWIRLSQVSKNVFHYLHAVPAIPIIPEDITRTTETGEHLTMGLLNHCQCGIGRHLL